MAWRTTIAVLFCVLHLLWPYIDTVPCRNGQFGDDCSYLCHCAGQCHQESGECNKTCDTGWVKGGNICQKQNIAYNKTASTTSGVYANWPASKAVDGDNDINGQERTCFHAAGSPSDWTVELGDQLSDIRVYIRDNFNYRIANSTVYLNNDNSDVCYTFPSTVFSNTWDLSCKGRANVVTIRNPGTVSSGQYSHALNICEVEIYVCSTGTYGQDCTAFCHCQSGPCDRTSGKCPGDCRPGWKGDNCSVACTKGSDYGVNCKKTCSNRKCLSETATCDHKTGNCTGGCRAGWREDDCTEKCTNNTYGLGCATICDQRNCERISTCDHVTGSCDYGCTAGWTGADCKTACNDTHYGINCSKLCRERKCVTEQSSCDRITGSCDTGCIPGWTNTDCSTKCRYRTYGVKCLSCADRHCEGKTSCNHVTGTCDLGCSPGWMGTDCLKGRPGGLDPVIAGVIGAVVGAVVGVIATSIVFVIIFYLCIKKRLISRNKLKYSSTNQKLPIEMDAIDLAPTQDTDRHTYSNDYSMIDPDTRAEISPYDVISATSNK